MRTLLAIACIFLINTVFATHNRAGEIYYKRIAPFSKVIMGNVVPVYMYSITLVKYTDDGPNIADRCVDTVYFGDGNRAVVYRENGFSCNKCNFQATCGELISSAQGYVVKKNVYSVIHEYSNTGTYYIRNFDRNRNEGVLNVPNSVQQPFYVEAMLVINFFTGANSSPVFGFPPIDRGCVGYCFEHNPGAYDPDKKDSLSYELTTVRGLNGQTIPGYTFPFAGAPGTFSIDPLNGKLSWCVPAYQGEYNIAFKVLEWRKNTSGQYELVGYVMRDMQVIINVCPKNVPPQITPIADTCVEAGTLVKRSLEVRDPNTGWLVSLQGEAGAFQAYAPPAVLGNTIATMDSLQNNTLKAQFEWQTGCQHIQNQYYRSVLKASDNGPTIQLVSFQNFNIRVLPPAVKQVSVYPQGSAMKISWQPVNCNPSTNPLKGYEVYRIEYCLNSNIPACAPAPPDNLWRLVGSVGVNQNTLTDLGFGTGLVAGQYYTYIVYAVYSDGVRSIASAPKCGLLKRDIPVLLNTDVITTHSVSGSVFLKWKLPLCDTLNLDTTQYLAPYAIRIFYSKPNAPFTAVYQTAFKKSVLALDTAWTHVGINTYNEQHRYRLQLISANDTVGESPQATSVFLSGRGTDRCIRLQWISETPWRNTRYDIYRKAPNETGYTYLGQTAQQSWLDSGAIVNRKSYCYYVKSHGYYSDSTLPHPLYNRSQERCITPLDSVLPCIPQVTLIADCPAGQIQLRWNNIRTTCSDDVVYYLVYYKSILAEAYTRLLKYPQDTVLEYFKSDTATIRGCYAVQAVDSSGNAGPLSTAACVDNCPRFELPNVFSPNADGANDVFRAIWPFRHVQAIELRVFDRWGNIVFSTEDPYFKWDGIAAQSKIPCADGVYFYQCTVYETRISGIAKRYLKGSLTLVR